MGNIVDKLSSSSILDLFVEFASVNLLQGICLLCTILCLGFSKAAQRVSWHLFDHLVTLSTLCVKLCKF
jgi:hypothetical protein